AGTRWAIDIGAIEIEASTLDSATYTSSPVGLEPRPVPRLVCRAIVTLTTTTPRSQPRNAQFATSTTTSTSGISGSISDGPPNSPTIAGRRDIGIPQINSHACSHK